jgi:hypothetical protein
MIGAIATGVAADNEIVIFNATDATPDDSDIISRVRLTCGVR